MLSSAERSWWPRPRGARAHAVRQAKAMLAEIQEWLELARDAWAEAREEGQGHVSAGLAALRAVAGRQAKDLAQNEIKERLPQTAGHDLCQEHDHMPGQGNRHMRGRLADVLGKACAEDQGLEKAHKKEREQELDGERICKHEPDRDLGRE